MKYKFSSTTQGVMVARDFDFHSNSTLLEMLTVVGNLTSKNSLHTDSMHKQMIRSNCTKLFRRLVALVQERCEVKLRYLIARQ